MKVMLKEAGKEKSGARAEFEPHFILDFRFLFFKSNGGTHNNFFLVTAYTVPAPFFFPV
jgi:hypothetical protein